MAKTKIYLTIDGITPSVPKGESPDTTKPDGILCYYYSYAANVELHTGGSGGGSAVGKPHRTPVTVHKAIDDTSPDLMKYLLQGKSLKKASIELRSGNKILYTITLEGVHVTGIQYSVPDTDDAPDAIEEVEFNFQKITFKSASGKTVKDDTLSGKVS